MTTDEETARQSTDVADDDPSVAYTISLQMENLLDKLKLLDYENEYVEQMKMKPIHRQYFIMPSNPGEQFFSLISLAAWLIRKTGKPFEQPQEYDDPNSVISNILVVLKESKFDQECPPNKLKQGYGVHAVSVLTFLSDLALKIVNFTFSRPVMIDKVEEIAEVEGAEIFLDKVEEEMFASFSDDEQEVVLDGGEDVHLSALHTMPTLESKRPNKVLPAAYNLDVAAWQSEVERVAPALKISYNLETTNWRLHVTESAACTAQALDNLQGARQRVDALLAHVTADMDKIASKETHTGHRVVQLLAEHKLLKDELTGLKGVYDGVNGGVKSRSATLSGIHEEIETMKQEMEERGANMTDGSQLVVMKRSLSNINHEITAMDTRIAILEHCLLQARMRQKRQLQKEMSDATQLSPGDNAA